MDQYFQGILQLRNPNEDVIVFVEKYHNYISKKIKQKDGFDYYFVSNKLLRHLAKKLKQNFGGILKESPKLYTRDRQTQKPIYRLSVLFRLFDFQKNDVLAFNNQIIKVTNSSNKVSGIDIKRNKRVSFLFKNLKDYKVLNIFNTRIIKIHPEIEILDEDYQPVKVENKVKAGLNEKVRAVFCNGYWIV